MGSPLVIRPLRSRQELAACVELQKAIWGADLDEIVAPILLQVAQRIGGVAVGAFDETDRLLGCVFGLTGIEDGRLVHWSHLLAVRPDVRGTGIGRRLKEHQRDVVRALGVELMYWTFDPLIARNAHLNLTRLGAEVVEYVPDMYGRTGSELDALGTDRLVVAWDLTTGAGSDERRRQARRAALRPTDAAEPPLGAPIANLDPDGEPVPPDHLLPADPVVRIEIPAEMQAVLRTSPEAAQRWQRSIRHAFLTYLGRGYRVAAFHRDLPAGRGHYLLAIERPPRD
jgi:chorismate synthase